ncbi:hypothetical protein KC332_g1508 [Hortaea werneckii]|nr:hypothetical protein KC358_g1091 [Hortaea werneckii]KAI6944015.1 hypothetical protein KC341_g1094 [Hortaea werneckii]KAI6949414.1 hypothetical protein KC348_g1345 [Hortaea werneckii]KAI6981164.1 hypothetical protein KC321_g1388 [Hortaea werneckii]KAI6997465.1 hypothetical protein KC329_g1568 [Hortaea werneckii]
MPSLQGRDPQKESLSDAISRLRAAFKHEQLSDVETAIAHAQETLDSEPYQKVLDIALSIACDKSFRAAVEFLLSQRADPNARATNGHPPLRRAVEKCRKTGCASESIVELLLKHGAQAEVFGQDKTTPLMLARSTTVVRLLLSHGANVNATDNEGRSVLMYAQHEDIISCLLGHQAKLEARDHQGNTALSHYLKKDKDAKLAHFLIDRHADVNAADNVGRTVLMYAVWKNHVDVVKRLLSDKDVDLSQMDSRRRNVWHHFAMDTDRRMHGEGDKTAVLFNLLLGATQKVSTATSDILKARDVRDRTCLHWAAASGNLWIARALLERGLIEVGALEHRNKTSLHLAIRFAGTLDLTFLSNLQLSTAQDDGAQPAPTPATPQSNGNLAPPRGKARKQGSLGAQEQSNQSRLLGLVKNIVALLLQYGADVNAESDGGWTPLHTACVEQATPLVVDQLLQNGARPNRRTLSGKTPFHLSCENGLIELVKYFLERKDVLFDTKDNFGNSPLLAAANSQNLEIVQLLAPWTDRRRNRLSEAAKKAAQSFNATIVDFGMYRKHIKRRNIRRKTTIYDLLYSEPATDEQATRSLSTVCSNSSNDKTDFRWIHLPVNNVQWCQELITKRFIEEGAVDIEGFKLLERAFLYQHRGQKVHSSYMRPMCRTVPRSKSRAQEEPEEENSPVKDIIVTQHASPGALPVRQSNTDIPSWRFSTNFLPPNFGPPRRVSTGISVLNTDLDEIERTAEGDRPRSPSRPREAPESVKKARARSAKYPETNVFLFAPYLHFETDLRRREMQKALQAMQTAKLTAGDGRQVVCTMTADNEVLESSPEFALYQAHLHSELHIRRTLDQSFYRTIDTDARDTDQVIYRYEQELSESKQQEDPRDDVKVLMVDQLWMWILGDDLVVTSFPQRWRQPPKDPLNVLEGIMEEINSATTESVDNVYDLAILIAGRCFGTFDQSDVRSDGSRFLDMFESSIGKAMDDETHFFAEFDHASRQISGFLSSTLATQSQQMRDSDDLRKLPADKPAGNQRHSHRSALHKNKHPRAMQTLLDIAAEIELLSDVKDIRDELDMLRLVFEQQTQVIPGVHEAVDTILGHEKGSEGRRSKVLNRLGYHERAIDRSVKEIERMDKQAERIYVSIRDLLDLKQKHANAVEASYARIQASETARQGQILMVFTIVTVIFLPLSFIAAFLDLEIAEYPHNQGSQQLTLGYALKYTLGIGGGIAAICVILALSANRMQRGMRRLWAHVIGGSDQPADPQQQRSEKQERPAAPSATGKTMDREITSDIRSRARRSLRPASLRGAEAAGVEKSLV